MKHGDIQVGAPMTLYSGTTAEIEAIGSPSEGMIAYSTDDDLIGIYTTAGWVWISTSAGGGHVIQDEGLDLTQRTNLNFVGDGVTASDDAGNDATVVTIAGGGSYDMIQQRVFS